LDSRPDETVAVFNSTTGPGQISAEIVARVYGAAVDNQVQTQLDEATNQASVALNQQQVPTPHLDECFDGYSGFRGITAHLDHISHYKTIYSSNRSKRWTCSVFIINTRRD
jgi:hypothetical protein